MVDIMDIYKSLYSFKNLLLLIILKLKKSVSMQLKIYVPDLEHEKKKFDYFSANDYFLKNILNNVK